MPISGFKGDNITTRSANTPWYSGPTLVDHLETVEVNSSRDLGKPFRLPVQWVNRPNLDFRGFSGLIATGSVKPGDAVRVLPSGKTSTVTRVVTMDGDLDQGLAGQSVTVCFADEIDCSRGDVIALADQPPQAADQFESTIVWLNDEPLHVGRAYWLKLGTQTVSVTVQQPKYAVNVNTMEHIAVKPGSEEYLDSEKYQLRYRDFRDLDGPNSLRDFIALINRIRQRNPALQADWSLCFHAVDNEQIICYSKATDNRANVLLMVVNLDPNYTQAGWTGLDLEVLGVDPHQPFQVHDLLTGAHYIWTGPRNYVELNPHRMPAHVFRIRSSLHTEHDFATFDG